MPCGETIAKSSDIRTKMLAEFEDEIRFSRSVGSQPGKESSLFHSAKPLLVAVDSQLTCISF